MKTTIENSRKILTILLFAAIFAAVFSSAFATSYASAESTRDVDFVRLFPTVNYFQSANPSLVSANADYLLVYDKDVHSLFVRPNDSSDTYVYETDFENVTSLFVLENVAFLQADDKYYTIDISDKTANAVEVALTSPSRIASITSDGTRLYAHSPKGALTIYDKTLSQTYNVDAEDSPDELAGSNAIAGENGNLYTFPSIYGNAFFVKFDTTSNTVEAHPITQNITQAYVGDVVYALEVLPATGQKRLICLDKTTGELLFHAEIYPQAFFAYGNRVFTIENKSVVVYTLASDKSSLSRTTSITMTGNDAYHLDNPVDLCTVDDGYIVADKNNSRLATIDKSGVLIEHKLDDTPLALTSSERDVYCVFQDRIDRFSGGKTTKTYELSGVQDVAYSDKLYALAQGGVYTAIGNSLIKIFDVENGKRIATAKNGTNVYVLTADSVLCIDRNGTKLFDVANADFAEAVDFAIDYTGKAYVAFKDRIVTYYANQSQTIAVKAANLKASITSVCLDGENVVFTAEESFVGTLNVHATTKQSFNATLPTLERSEYYFATADGGALEYSWDGRLENTQIASSDVYLVIDKAIEGADENLRYALVGNKLAIVSKDDFTVVETTALSGEYVAKEDVTLYALPYSQNGAIEIKAGEKVARISDVAGYDNSKWTIVQYGENTYFVNSSAIEEYVEIVDEKDKVYGRANADRVGGMVNVYAAADKNSEVILQIVDGSQVEVLETLDNFYLVTFDGKVGYIEKEHLKINGLTTVQIVAIVLAIIVALAGSAIFASIYLTRKNGDKDKKGEDKTPKRF